MNSFLAEQAMLLANNSVSLTQISSKPSNNFSNNSMRASDLSMMKEYQSGHQNQPSPTPRIEALASSSPSSSTSNLSKYSQLLLVLEEMSKDIR
jgi:hypothetical protein